MAAEGADTLCFLSWHTFHKIHICQDHQLQGGFMRRSDTPVTSIDAQLIGKCHSHVTLFLGFFFGIFLDFAGIFN